MGREIDSMNPIVSRSRHKIPPPPVYDNCDYCGYEWEIGQRSDHSCRYTLKGRIVALISRHELYTALIKRLVCACRADDQTKVDRIVNDLRLLVRRNNTQNKRDDLETA